jgi:hypothetical protein
MVKLSIIRKFLEENPLNPDSLPLLGMGDDRMQKVLLAVLFSVSEAAATLLTAPIVRLLSRLGLLWRPVYSNFFRPCIQILCITKMLCLQSQPAFQVFWEHQ